MKEIRKLGDFIQPVDVRNTDLSVTRLLGLSINKCFIESIANTIGTDFRPYKIVKKGQFAYGPVTSRNGEKITIALLEESECIISSSYAVFEITDTSKLLPEYLMLWFSRPEFDRYARYKSHGSVREIFDWDEMYRVELPVPDIKEQQKIVNTYNAITNRIQIKQKINENLEKTALCLFEEITKENCSEVKLKDFCTMQYGYTETANFEPIGKKFVRITDITSAFINWDTVPYCKIDYKNFELYKLNTGDVIVARTGATVGVAKIIGRNHPDLVFASFLVRIKSNDELYKNIIGLSVVSKKFLEYVQMNAGGSAQPQADPPLLGEY
ncbi:MAG: restriction endonuclease subunit S, partial [Treponema sp.]|nr:restriction endonuclease subunit S [Candidatus Treponema caballi]